MAKTKSKITATSKPKEYRYVLTILTPTELSDEITDAIELAAQKVIDDMTGVKSNFIVCDGDGS